MLIVMNTMEMYSLEGIEQDIQGFVVSFFFFNSLWWTSKVKEVNWSPASTSLLC